MSGTVTLWCVNGHHHWDRPVTRARRPRHCPAHGGPAFPMSRVEMHEPDPSRTAREDIDDRRRMDRDRNQPTVDLLRARVEAVAAAHAHAHELGPWELRQMLIDLASACEEWASELPAPGVLTQRQQARRAAA